MKNNYKYLIEDNKLLEGYTIDQTKAIPTGTTMSNGMNVFGYDTRSLDTYGLVFVYTDESKGGQNYSCTRHENGQYRLSPRGTLTKEESQKMYDAFCTKEDQSQKDFIVPIFPDSSNSLANNQTQQNNQRAMY